ncbi:protein DETOXIFICATION 46, chloroplastic-like isoform X1 [Ananas comosus]|uniref:Protein DETOXIFICATION 46, chloroplastic-like isoform X1 n=1 Tax=Ananas comosus TaxID=4615 RepID=A0A6P5F654_ANACO|nr:protein DETOXIFICATION 46, chloroplastic-like isoform X1 [Ananas comosus]
MALRLLAFSSSFSSSLLRFSPTTSPRSIPSSSSFPHLPSPSPSPSNPLSRTPHSNGAPRLRPISRSHAPGSDSGLAPLLPTDDGAAAAAAELAPSDSTSIWKQMKEIALFAGPATGLWICGPLMSLIDTMVIGQGSSLELAALGPATVFCDYLSYIFMFLSIATSNMVATSLAKKDKELVQHQISILLFVAFACGLGMFMFTRLLGPQILAAFTGPENLHIVPAANTYAQIRGFAWPAILVGMVAQSASLGMKDSWGPLKALTVASAINGFGDIFLCSICGYGIAGAALATMVSQVVAAFMMMQTLNKTGFQAFSMSIPSVGELFQIFEIAAPVFVTMTSKGKGGFVCFVLEKVSQGGALSYVAFYSLLTYFATSMGTITLAAHQVMINVFCMCTVWGEPLSQTAQSFMPELIHGVNRSLVKDILDS